MDKPDATRSASGKITMEYVDRDQNVDPKLVIVTSGYGGIYPPDIPVGVVSSVGEQDVNNYKQIAVQPFLDFRVLEEVMVLIVPTDSTSVVPGSTSTTGVSGTTSSTGPDGATGTTGGLGTTATTTKAKSNTTTSR